VKHLEHCDFAYEYAGETMVVDLGVMEDGTKRILGLRQGATENADVCTAVRAAVLSGRWDQVLDRTRAATARDRRTDWRWEPLACLAELKALDDQDEGSPQPSTKKHSKRTAA
jgi:hypothetical protein